MRNFKNDFPKYVASVFKARLKELGLSQYRFVNERTEYANRPTLTRILRGDGSSSISTIAHYADMLGMEIIIRPKEQDNEDKD